MVTQPDDAKRFVIHAAAISEFSARGFNRTSMSNIAEAAGMSRPALYQYFKNKGDIFGSAFVALLDAKLQILASPLSLFFPPLSVLLAPRARERGVQRGEERGGGVADVPGADAGEGRHAVVVCRWSAFPGPRPKRVHNSPTLYVNDDARARANARRIARVAAHARAP